MGHMWAAFLIGLAAGIAATPHCLGMCGGFSLYLGKTSSGSHTLRQLLFIGGKSFTYVFLGALAAAAGIVLFRNTSLAVGAPFLRLTAGIITCIFGLSMLGLRLPAIRNPLSVAESAIARGMFGRLLAHPGASAAFVLGLGVGFIPCPLPISMLLIAVGSHDIPLAMSLMFGMGLGTTPGLLAVGMFGHGLSRRSPRLGMRAAGAVVLAIGLLTIGRASGLTSALHQVNHVPSCCQQNADR